MTYSNAMVKSGRRVVVTGWGVVTCLGVGVNHVWNRLLIGHSGISALTSPGCLPVYFK